MRKRPNDVEKLDQISQSINSDGKGNLTVGKDLGVDGKLKLKSLVSSSNPDGDITKELGASGMHCYTMIISNRIHYQVYTTKNYEFEINKATELPSWLSNPDYNELHADGKYPVSGYWTDNTNSYTMIVNILKISGAFNFIEGYDIIGNKYKQNVRIEISNAIVIKQY